MTVDLTLSLTPTAPPASVAGVPHTLRTTVADMTDYLRSFMGADAGAEMSQLAKRSVQAALRELANAANWSYLYTHGRLQTYGSYGTGTITGDVTGGTYENMVTLSGGTWPTWAAYGSLRVGAVTYDVKDRVSDTVLTLQPALAPTADVAAGTAYTLYRDTYTLPEDFAAMDSGFGETSYGKMQFVHPSQWLQIVRYYQASSNAPYFYSITGDPKIPNRMCVRIFPYPDVDRTVDFVYKRRPRAVTIERYETGTASVDASGGSTTTITGTSTSWTAAMSGSVIRLSANALAAPTGFAGSNPAAVERNIATVAGAASLAADDVIGDSYTRVKYTVSDPVDVEDGAMLEAFFRCCEKHAAVQRRMKGAGEYVTLYDRALLLAREADARSLAGREAGPGHTYRQRLARMPMGSDVG